MEDSQYPSRQGHSKINNAFLCTGSNHFHAQFSSSLLSSSLPSISSKKTQGIRIRKKTCPPFSDLEENEKERHREEKGCESGWETRGALQG